MEDNNLGLYTISLKNYRRTYLQVLIINSLAVIGSFFLVRNNFYIFFLEPGIKIANPVIIEMTTRYVFLYFAAIDLFITLMSFPNKIRFRKELKNDDVEFV